MTDLTDRRPSPDALLNLAAQERRGKLKIFLGAAPGVGKTFAMLSAAQRLKAEGKDIVIGLVETHGRTATAALLNGLEVLPRRSVSYRGQNLMEFDIDGALARKPELIIIDELAHTNAPDSRHPKRYQDIEELVDSGLSVWTALNIQHVESLADVVASITGVKVREVVPDTVIENADDVVVVDITPDELIQRLREGKVYLPDNARRASESFLKPSNLMALRELALRKTAQRVDDQMVDILQQQAIQGPWPSAERLLVCVGGDELSEQVVRTAARIANGLNASWLAVHLTRSGGENLELAESRRVDDVLALATRLGAETTRLSANDLSSEVLRFARNQNITQIVIGRSPVSLLKRILGLSLPDDIISQAQGIGIHLVTLPAKNHHPPKWKWPQIEFTGLVSSPAAVAVATLVALVAQHFLKLPNISIIYLTAVLFCAVLSGTWSAVAAAFLSFLAYNFFFIAPTYSFTVASPHELLALSMFLLAAVLTGSLAGRVREQKFAALGRVKQIQTLFDVSRKLSATPAVEDIAWIVATQAAASVKGESIVLLKRGDDIEIASGMPPEDTLGAADWAAARWTMQRNEAAGWATNTLPNANFQFRPLRTATGNVGIVGVRSKDARLSQAEEQIIDALLDQAAVAIERTFMSGEAAKARTVAEQEKLRSALLSSVSHDLRTPLSSILGSVTTLRTLGPKLSLKVRDDLLENIEEETTRLSRFVSDLLDMTRLEAGAVEARRERFDVMDVTGSAARRARVAWPERNIDINSAEQHPHLLGDPVLFEQLIFNLLENAHRYSSAGTPTKVTVRSTNTSAEVAVEDQGMGIPASELERIFEKFHRIKEGDGRPPGTGLGLAICRAIASSMNGTIIAESPGPTGRGSRFVVTLPLSSPA